MDILKHKKLFLIDFIANRFDDKSLIRVDRKFVVLFLGLILLFVLLVSFNIHYSSIGLWDDYLPRDPGTSYKSLIFGKLKPIRSDEWMIATPEKLGHYMKIANNKSGSLLLKEIINPAGWGYLIFGLEKGFSYSENFWFFATFISFFLLFMILTRNEFLLSVFGALFVMLSAFNRWWGLSTNLSTFCLPLTFFILFIFSRKIHTALINFIIFAIFVWQFILIFYPAFQVPLAHLALVIGIGLFIRNRKKLPEVTYIRMKVILMIVGLIGAGILGTLWFIANQDYLKSITNTVYPGLRFSSGGDIGVARLFSGFYDLFQNEKVFFWHNICETSSFILLYPFIIIMMIYHGIKTRQISLMPVLLAIYLILFSVYSIIGFPAWLSNISLMRFVPAQRALIGIGLANIALVVIFLKDYDIKKVKVSWVEQVIFIPVISTILLLYSLLLNSSIEQVLSANKIIIIVSVFTVIVFLLLSGRKILFIFSIMLILIIPSFGSNPVAVGIGPIYKKSLVRFIVEIQKKDPNSKWVAYGNNVIPNLIKATGANVFNGKRFPPDLKAMRSIDIGNKYADVYNRYAVIVMHPNEIKESRFELVQGDMYALYIHPCSPKLRQLGIKYFVMPNNPEYFNIEKNKKCGLITLTDRPLNNYWVLKRTN